MPFLRKIAPLVLLASLLPQRGLGGELPFSIPPWITPSHEREIKNLFSGEKIPLPEAPTASREQGDSLQSRLPKSKTLWVYFVKQETAKAFIKKIEHELEKLDYIVLAKVAKYVNDWDRDHATHLGWLRFTTKPGFKPALAKPLFLEGKSKESDALELAKRRASKLSKAGFHIFYAGATRNKNYDYAGVIVYGLPPEKSAPKGNKE